MRLDGCDTFPDADGLAGLGASFFRATPQYVNTQVIPGNVAPTAVLGPALSVSAPAPAPAPVYAAPAPAPAPVSAPAPAPTQAGTQPVTSVPVETTRTPAPAPAPAQAQPATPSGAQVDTGSIIAPTGSVELDPGSIGYGQLPQQSGAGQPSSGGSGLIWLALAAAAALAGGG